MADLSAATRDAVREGVKSSAAVILPLAFEYLGVPDSLLDCGAGEGHWMDEARVLGVRAIVGLDVRRQESPLGLTVYEWDAERPDYELPLWQPGRKAKWNLALCLEMAEHVSPQAGDHLVSELTRVADAILFSAAIPGQGGDGHVNEQWPNYWQERFWANGFSLTDPFREALWSNTACEPWYAQNLLLALPKDRLPVGEFTVRHLVHPVTWAHHRGVPAPSA